MGGDVSIVALCCASQPRADVYIYILPRNEVYSRWRDAGCGSIFHGERTAASAVAAVECSGFYATRKMLLFFLEKA